MGNPPFLGGTFLRRELGDDYVDDLHFVWEGKVPGKADLCCYWHEKARRMVADGKAHRVGLLATQGIRGGRNRIVLQRIKESGDIFFAESDRKWMLDGAAVQVSMVGFDDGSETERVLDGQRVEGINANLTSGADLTLAAKLRENAGLCFEGVKQVGRFDIDAGTAATMIAMPNPDGRSNADVVRPSANGRDINGRSRGMWVIDFPPGTPLEEAELYEAPFEHIAEHVREYRKTARSGDRTGVDWWIHGSSRPGMRQALAPHQRYIVTTATAKHRLFTWLDREVLPDHALFVFARDDDYFFGVLHSRLHELWALAQGTQLREKESGFRYTPTTCFLTFPLPWPPGEEPADSPLVRGIAEAARRLHELREGWLNPEGPLVADLRQRTLTNLYNERPAWLDTAHRRLDEAVCAAYGWPPDLPDDEVLARLLALNLERARA